MRHLRLRIGLFACFRYTRSPVSDKAVRPRRTRVLKMRTIPILNADSAFSTSLFFFGFVNSLL